MSATLTADTEPFEVRNRWTGNVQFTAQIESGLPGLRFKLGAAVRWARREGANLRDANLSGAVLRDAVLRDADLRDADLSDADLRDAVLRGADLRGADLSGAVLRDAVLRDAVLRGADLSGADLSGAVLRDADLSGAVLRGADLRDADLSDADLSGAVLRGADLSGAVLRDAVLRDAVLRPIRADLYDVLVNARGEAPAFLAALRAGQVDGTTYSGPCACLVGTIANARGVDWKDLNMADSSRPIERFVLGIKKGDTPETNPVAALLAEWTERFIGLPSEQVAA